MALTFGYVLRRALTRYGLLAVLFNSMLLTPAMAKATKILALGDSLTAGYNLPAQDAFPVKLEKALRAQGYDVSVVNAGVSGDTAAGGLARLDWALADKPDFAIVELGGNDALRGLDPKETYTNLDMILARLKASGVKVLLAGMYAPRNMGKEYGAEFQSIYVRLKDKYNVAFYPFFLDGVAAKPEFGLGDGIHPNGRGVDVIVERILPHVKELLGKPG